MKKRVTAPRGKWENRRQKKRKLVPVKNPSYKSVLGQQIKTTFVYAETFNLNPGVGGTPSNYVFSANGLYDPNITGIGHQPRGFDQIMSLYDHATVIAFKAEIFCHNQDSGNAVMLVGYLNDDNTPVTSQYDVMEKPTAKIQIISPEQSGPNVGKMVYTCNPNQFLGRPHPLSVDNLRNSKTSNPAEQVFFILSAFPLGTGDHGDVNMYVRLEYTAILFEPDYPGQS